MTLFIQASSSLYAWSNHFPDIKPDNIIVNYRGTGPETIVEQVRIIDLETEVH